MISVRNRLACLAAKWLSYAVLLGLVCGGAVLGGTAGAPFDLIYGEDGIVEWTQIVILVSSIIVLNCAGRLSCKRRVLTNVLALLLCGAVIRELDHLFDVYVMKHFWKPLCCVFIVLTLWLVRVRFQEFCSQALLN